MSAFTPADAHERDGLRLYLARLLALDTRASVRLQGSGSVLGVWAGPPLDVVCLRPVGLAAPIDPLDVTHFHVTHFHVTHSAASLTNILKKN